MKYDGKINLADAKSSGSRVWKNKKWSWSDFITRLSTPHFTNETLKEYLGVSKEEQKDIKNVGGYVGGYLRAGRRKISNVLNRQVLTLDLDFAPLTFWDTYTMLFDNAAVLHSTHKHCDENPRFRLIVPLNREVTPDEYSAISRKFASQLNIDFFDLTTFEVNRLMYWQSTPKDQDYFFEALDGPWLDADEILEAYTDWTDVSSWPTGSQERDIVSNLAKKQQDPEEKTGIIGAFCRTYQIDGAITAFLSDSYEAVGEDRYTYSKGSTSGGLVVYQNKFAYSHHGTDPISGSLCNAFDLVRVHKFGHLDNEGKSNKSFKEMERLVLGDKQTKKTIGVEKLSEAKYDFATEVEEVEENALEWTEELEVDGRGKYLSSAVNLNLIFANDPQIKGAFVHNSFDTKRYVTKNLPWRKVKKAEAIKNVDYSGIRNYIETVYGIAGNLKVDDCLALEFERHSFHPVKDYLEGLKWDEVKRIDSFLHEYFGVDLNAYTQEALRKTLAAAVTRIYRPGAKFDLVLTLCGPQGSGKSTLPAKLGGAWFSDSFMSFTGKESFEQLQGAWIMEMPELSKLKKTDVESVKQYITKQEDTYRPAYGKVTETYRRQVVFIGTTNSHEFLNDPSGNRRFMPIDLQPFKATKSIFEISKEEVSQIWAEAKDLYEKGEKLYLSKEAEGIARGEQREHSQTDEKEGIIEKYLNTMLPNGWDELDIFERRDKLNDPLSARVTKGFYKEFTCVAEIWCECLGRAKEDMDRYKTRDINEVLKSLEGWEQSKSTKNFKFYGKQKYYRRILTC